LEKDWNIKLLIEGLQIHHIFKERCYLIEFKRLFQRPAKDPLGFPV